MREIAIEASRYRRLPSGKAVFLARMAEDPVDALYVRSRDGEVTRAFAPPPSPDGKVRTIAFFVPAPNERYVALAMGEDGSENNALYVLDLEKNELIDGPIPGVRFKSISWWPDSRRFVYPRLREADSRLAGAALYALVLEVAFDSVHESRRHKSGIAMRFPRISRLRRDKPADEADHIGTLRRMIADHPAG